MPVQGGAPGGTFGPLPKSESTGDRTFTSLLLFLNFVGGKSNIYIKQKVPIVRKDPACGPVAGYKHCALPVLAGRRGSWGRRRVWRCCPLQGASVPRHMRVCCHVMSPSLASPSRTHVTSVSGVSGEGSAGSSTAEVAGLAGPQGRLRLECFQTPLTLVASRSSQAGARETQFLLVAGGRPPECPPCDLFKDFKAEIPSKLDLTGACHTTACRQ